MSREEVGHQEVSRLRRKFPGVIAQYHARSKNRADGSTPMVKHDMQGTERSTAEYLRKDITCFIAFSLASLQT